MHRKRVICELHDSYFRSMTIKHAIPKTAEVHIPMASYGKILEWALNYYISQYTGNPIEFLEITELEKWFCRENSLQQKGPSGPTIEQLGIRRVEDKTR